MAVTKEQPGQETEVRIIITNGDWASLKRARDAYHLKDEADVIAFAIGVLEQSAGQGVVVETPQGRSKLVPAEKLKRTP